MTTRLARASTVLAVKAPHPSGYPGPAHAIAVMRYFDHRFGPLQHAQAPRVRVCYGPAVLSPAPQDPTSSALRQTLFVRLPSDRARQALEMGRHAIPLPTDRLRGFIDSPGRRDYRATLDECLPDGNDPASAARTFDVRVERLHEGAVEARSALSKSASGFARTRRRDDDFEALWALHGRFAPKLARPHRAPSADGRTL